MLLQPAGVEGHLRPHPLRVLPRPRQPQLQVAVAQLAGRPVVVHEGRPVEVVDHQVQGPVPVQVRVRRPVRVRGRAQPPLPPLAREGQVAVVAEDVVCHVRRGHLIHQVQHVLPHHATGLLLHEVAHVFDKIHVGIVAHKAIGDEEVFPAVVVVIGEEGRPAPVGVGDARQLPHLAEGAVAVVELQHVAHVLVVEAVFQVKLKLLIVVGGEEQLLAPVVLGQHVQRVDVRQPVVVNVGDVVAH